MTKLLPLAVIAAAVIGYHLAPREITVACALPKKDITVALKICEGDLKLALNTVHAHQDALTMAAANLGECFTKVGNIQ